MDQFEGGGSLVGRQISINEARHDGSWVSAATASRLPRRSFGQAGRPTPLRRSLSLAETFKLDQPVAAGRRYVPQASIPEITVTLMTQPLSRVLDSLAQLGWALHTAPNTEGVPVQDAIRTLGDLLGTRVFCRANTLEEVITPQRQSEAHPGSLSARYGLNSLPFHIELSHRLRPCRFLLLGCIEPGSQGSVTKLIDWQGLGFSPDEHVLLESAPVLVRSGRYSFYSTILSPNRTFIRYDPGCLEAVEERGHSALDLVRRRLGQSSPESHEWRRGDILVIDNWRVLHGRNPSTPNSGRHLTRILINAR